MLDLAVDNDVNHRELRPGQIFVFLQLFVELANNLILKRVKQESEFFLGIGVILIWKRSWLEHSLHQTPDQLARVAANLAIEIARDGGDGLVLVFIFVSELVLSLLTSAQKPLEKSKTFRQHAVAALNEQRYIACWIDCFEFCSRVFLLESIDEFELVLNICILASDEHGPGVRTKVVTIDDQFLVLIDRHVFWFSTGSHFSYAFWYYLNLIYYYNNYEYILHF